MTYGEALYTLKNASWLAVSDSPYLAKVEEAIETLEAAEPVRRGKWERCVIKTYDFTFYCSECNSFSPNGIRTKYCPWCGAYMEV